MATPRQSLPPPRNTVEFLALLLTDRVIGSWGNVAQLLLLIGTVLIGLVPLAGVATLFVVVYLKLDPQRWLEMAVYTLTTLASIGVVSLVRRLRSTRSARAGRLEAERVSERCGK
ncbi:MAG: hypothetical protein HKP61_23160 [Dactylosporangium sp.]|nr:hypothetical protein [Dactylosporangium sp.]NNJ63779.1 hypothetical protein [Dactylosporangium sp.]